MKYIIFLKNKDYEGGNGYMGNICRKANITPGLIYKSYSSAEQDMVKLNRIEDIFEVRDYISHKDLITNGETSGFGESMHD